MVKKTLVKPDVVYGSNGNGSGDEVSLLNLDVAKLSRIELAEAATYSREQALATVGFYYGIQKLRVGAGNKEDAHNRKVDIISEPHIIIRLKEETRKVEEQAKRALEMYAKNQPLGKWALSITGVGPVIAAGLLAHIDIRRARTLGSILRFAGLVPPEDIKWEKGEKRPYNAALKTLCWKLGESFKKAGVSEKTLNSSTDDLFKLIKEESEKKKRNLSDEEIAELVEKKKDNAIRRSNFLKEESYLYVRIYMERKKLETERNDRGLYREKAQARLDMPRRYPISVAQKEIWESGRLQPVGIDRRAMRHAVKMFLSHFHHVGWNVVMGQDPPVPYVFAHQGDRHTHYIAPPLWPGLK